MEVKTIKIEIGQSFVANGVKYTATNTLSIDRFTRATHLSQDIARGNMDNNNEIDTLTRIFNHANKGNLAEVAVLSNNRLNSLKSNISIAHPLLRFVAQYINKENEDERRLTPEEEESKIKDWSEEGLSFESFLTFAFPMLSDILVKFDAYISDILKRNLSLQEAMSSSLDTVISTLREMENESESGSES